MVVSSKAKWFYTAEKEKGRREEKQVSCWHGRMGIQQNSIHRSDPDRTQSKAITCMRTLYYIILYQWLSLHSLFRLSNSKIQQKGHLCVFVCVYIWVSMHLYSYVQCVCKEIKNDPCTVKYCPGVSATWWCWWTAGCRSSTVYLSHMLPPFNPTPSHSHYLPLWLITSLAFSLLLSFLNIMWDEVKCYGKLSKIKTREQLYSPMSCMLFIAQLLTEPCLRCPWRWVLMTDCRPWKEWECCIQWRWRCLHNTLSFTLYVLFSFPSHTLSAIFSSSLFSYPFFGSVPPRPPSPRSLFSAFVLPVPRLSPVFCVGLVICWNLKVFSISSSSTILLLSVPPPFYQHLPFPHSANLSPWHLSNSPCTHSVVPLIACSFTLPFFLPWLSLPWQSDNCWSIHC